jgi:hypothetical protein
MIIIYNTFSLLVTSTLHRGHTVLPLVCDVVVACMHACIVYHLHARHECLQGTTKHLQRFLQKIGIPLSLPQVPEHDETKGSNVAVHERTDRLARYNPLHGFNICGG